MKIASHGHMAEKKDFAEHVCLVFRCKQGTNVQDRQYQP